MLQITEINQVDEFLNLKSIWNNLLNKSNDNNPFLTWEYLSTYWKHFSEDRELRILCVNNEKKEIIGIAPLRLSFYKFANVLTYNVIEPLGCRGADYTGLIIPYQEIRCLRLILEYLCKKKDWDFIYLYDIPETSLVTYVLTKQTHSDTIIEFEVGNEAKCPYILLPNSMEAFMNKLSSNFRKSLKKHLKKLEKDFRKVELKSYKGFETVEEAMNTFFKLHQKRWTTRNMPGVFKTTRIQKFYVDIAKIFAENGWLALYFLTVDDKPIAARYGFEYNNKMYFCLPGFDPDYSQYAPGHIMHLKVIERCIRKGIAECDFLKGSEPYKFDWTNTYRTNLGFRFVNKSKITSKIYDFGIKTAKKTKADKILGRLLQF